MESLPLKLPMIRCASFMSTKHVSLPRVDISGESLLMLIGCKAIPNSCCNDQTAYQGSDILNPYFNPSAQRTGDTLVGLIGEPGPPSPFSIGGSNADMSFDQILAPLLASGSKTPDTYDYAWRDTPEQVDYQGWN